MTHQLSILLIVSVVLSGTLTGQLSNAQDRQLSFFFSGGYGQIEVGGRYVGVEFHRSRPLPSRISFYYPVANSIDLSTDYWRRAESQPLAIGVKVGDGEKRWLGKTPWAYRLSPHRVEFEHQEQELEYSITYEFCLNEPAMVLTFKTKNITGRSVSIEVYTHLRMALRTCQTYARKDSARTEFDGSLNMLVAHFDDPQTDRASVFVQNVGVPPRSWASSSEELAVTDSGTSRWISSTSDVGGILSAQAGKEGPVAAFTFRQEIQPGDSFSIIQVIGSCRRGELKERATRLSSSWSREVAAFDEFVRRKALDESRFMTGDPWLDGSAAWARGILAANAHYLDGKIVPMPCPAEYNFFFTHDLLLTDLGAVQSDLQRVKEDLLYVASLSKEDIIPHAYYWKDDGFKTEYATPDNWNHLWFILVTGSYLRHSMDDSTGKLLYPIVTKSLEEVLKQRKPDNLMYAYRPDWWDIGRHEGPRAYITILTIRALREYLYISSFLDKSSKKLMEYEGLAEAMQKALSELLWDEEAGYLLNFNGTAKDEHYYMGSLLAVVYDLLPPNRAKRLVETASRELVDPQLGVRTVAPADFHTEASRSFFQFQDNEAGEPYTYANGGVWPHGNAWYALALNATGRSDEAVQFLKTTMSLDGIARSPNGHPAMYEYRYSNPHSPEFGKIDKPSFLWAGGMYLHALYAVFGLNESEWNLSLSGPLPRSCDSVRFSLSFGDQKQVVIRGKGIRLQSLRTDGVSLPTCILPLEARRQRSVEVEFGRPTLPYVERVNAILHTANYVEDSKTLELTVSSFSGHKVSATVVAPHEAKKIVLDGVPLLAVRMERQPDRLFVLEIDFVGSDRNQKLEILF